MTTHSLETNSLNVKYCIICNGDTIGRPAKIAPFIAERCELNQTETRLRYCQRCDFAFFERRLSDKEAAKLYHDYRGPGYNDQRIKFEPHYKHGVQDLSNKHSDYYLRRLRTIALVMSLFPEITPKRIIDFGGDGEICKILFPCSVVHVDDLSEGSSLDANGYDFIFASNVFEHLSDPVSHLKKLKDRLSPSGILWIDVPIDYDGSIPISLHKHLGNEEGPIFMHEHINAFTPKSLYHLGEAVGLKQFFKTEVPVIGLFGKDDSILINDLFKLGQIKSAQFYAISSSNLINELHLEKSARKELQALRGSKSWKLTAPLRLSLNILKRIFKKI